MSDQKQLGRYLILAQQQLVPLGDDVRELAVALCTADYTAQHMEAAVRGYLLDTTFGLILLKYTDSLKRYHMFLLLIVKNIVIV